MSRIIDWIDFNLVYAENSLLKVKFQSKYNKMKVLKYHRKIMNGNIKKSDKYCDINFTLRTKQNT